MEPIHHSSIITGILNHLSDVAVSAISVGAVGYLLARAVKEIDPKAAFVCGAVSGGCMGLFWSKGANLSSFLVGLSLMILLPARVCAKQHLPMTFKMSLMISFSSLACLALIERLASKFFQREVEG